MEEQQEQLEHDSAEFLAAALSGNLSEAKQMLSDPANASLLERNTLELIEGFSAAARSSNRQSAKRLAESLARLKVDLVTLAQGKDASSCGIATLAHLHFSCDSVDLIPCVYDPAFMFQLFVPSALKLLDSESVNAKRTGLALIKELVLRLDNDGGIGADMAAQSFFTELLMSLARIITYQEEVSLRRLAFGLVSSLHLKVSFTSRPLFYLSVKKAASGCDNRSLEGWLGTCLKDSVILNLQKDQVCQDFSGEPLRRLCDKLLLTEVVEDCDIEADKDKLISSVNFFGCVLSFDCDDKAGIRMLMMAAVREKLLDRLSARLPIVKKAREAELEDLNKKSCGSDETFSIPGQPFASMDRKAYEEYLQSSIQVLDIMQYSMSRFSFL